MVPVLVGANDNDPSTGPAMTKDALFAKFGALAGEARELYDPKGNAGLKQLQQDIGADFGMIELSRHLADTMTRAGQPAYFYRFSYLPEAMRAKMPGVTHAGEIPFVFNCLSMVLKFEATAADLKMAADASAYWADFVKTGNPNGGSLPEWKPYDPTTREVLNFTNTGIAGGPDPIQARLDLRQEFWERSR